MDKGLARMAMVGFVLVGASACDMARDAKAALRPPASSKVTYNDGDERNAYAFGNVAPERMGIVQQNTREQRMRYCRQMFGLDGQPPTAPDYRPAPGDLCYSVWRDQHVTPELARFAKYYKKPTGR